MTILSPTGFIYPERIFSASYTGNQLTQKPILIENLARTPIARLNNKYAKFGHNLGPSRPQLAQGKFHRTKVP